METVPVLWVKKKKKTDYNIILEIILWEFHDDTVYVQSTWHIHLSEVLYPG